MGLIKKWYDLFKKEDCQQSLLSRPQPQITPVPTSAYFTGVSSSSFGGYSSNQIPNIECPVELDEAVNKVIAKMGGQDGSNDNE